MDFFETVRARQSVRVFDPRPVEEEKLRAILEAANAAPSAGNRQAYDIYVVRDPSRRAALRKAALDQPYVGSAPVALVFCADPARSAERYGERGARRYSLQDATIACTFAMLAATAQGLASVWVGAFDDEGVRQAIGAPAGQLPVAILPVGYGMEKPAPRPRRRLSDLVHQVRDGP